MIGETLGKEIWRSLVRGEALDRFRLPMNDGRLDLRELSLPDPQVLQRWQMPVAEVVELAQPEIRELHGVQWRNLDFSGSKLNALRFYSSEITNCRFDKCELKNLIPMATAIRDCSFRGANLQGSGLGTASIEGPRRGKRNTYVGVDFTAADLRGSIYLAAVFEHCVFVNTKLRKINFQNSTFADCRFEGELREVEFYRVVPGLYKDKFPPNEMLNVDFSRAKLRWVEFRGLTLEQVRLPNDSDHIIIEDFASALEKLIAALRSEPGTSAKGLTAMLEVCRKWAPPQGRGVLNGKDLAEANDESEETVARIVGLLQNIGAKTSLNAKIN